MNLKTKNTAPSSHPTCFLATFDFSRKSRTLRKCGGQELDEEKEVVASRKETPVKRFITMARASLFAAALLLAALAQQVAAQAPQLTQRVIFDPNAGDVDRINGYIGDVYIGEVGIAVANPVVAGAGGGVSWGCAAAAAVVWLSL
jgi:hypothetical protein